MSELKNVGEAGSRWIGDIANRWKMQYPNGHCGIYFSDIINCKTYDEIDALIGNRSWTSDLCRVCEEYQRKDLIVYFQGYDEWVSVCKPCLKKVAETYTI